jgi:hypothetical protein
MVYSSTTVNQKNKYRYSLTDKAIHSMKTVHKVEIGKLKNGTPITLYVEVTKLTNVSFLL